MGGDGLETERLMASTFDFPAFKRAFEAKDADAWLAFFAPGAEWWEYRHDAPPRAPHMMIGLEAIRERLDYVAAADLALTISDAVVGEERAAIAFWVTLADGRRLIEHAILHLEDGKITRQIDVEAWD